MEDSFIKIPLVSKKKNTAEYCHSVTLIIFKCNTVFSRKELAHLMQAHYLHKLNT